MEVVCLQDFGLGKGAVGAGACDDASLQERLARIDVKDFLVEVPTVSASCIDERVDAEGGRVQLAKTAGGPLSLVYALRLSGIDRYVDRDELQLVDLVMDTLESKGIAGQFAVHDDDHEGTVGCGACAKAHDVDNEIFGNFDAVSKTVATLTGSPLDASVKNSAKAMDVGFFADDRTKPVSLAQDDGAIIEDLVGDHDGQLIILNGTENTTVDSAALRAEGIRAFVVDHWVFPGLAAIFAKTDQEKTAITHSLLAFNLATASVLCHSEIVVNS